MNKTKTGMTPVRLEVLLFVYYSADCQPYTKFNKSLSTSDAITFLMRNGLIQLDLDSLTLEDECAKVYSITERGSFYIQHLLATPLPEQKSVWEIPKEAV